MEKAKCSNCGIGDAAYGIKEAPLCEMCWDYELRDECGDCYDAPKRRDLGICDVVRPF